MIYSSLKQKTKVRFKVYSRLRDLRALHDFLNKVDDAQAPRVFKELQNVLRDVLDEAKGGSNV